MNPEYVLISLVALSRHILQRECLIPCADEPQSPQGTAVCVLLRFRRGQQCRRFRQRRKAALPQGKLCFRRSRFRECSRFRRKRRRSQRLASSASANNTHAHNTPRPFTRTAAPFRPFSHIYMYYTTAPRNVKEKRKACRGDAREAASLREAPPSQSHTLPPP